MNRFDFSGACRVETPRSQGPALLRWISGWRILSGRVCSGKRLESLHCKSELSEHDFPDKKLVNDSHTHDLGKLLELAGLSDF
jgi:hypothetical protein